MRIEKIAIKNFRLLQDVELTLEAGCTTIVGRNNSGKTSVTELFRRILSTATPSFRLEDFSLAAHDKFWNAHLLKQGNATAQQVREALPSIEVRIWVGYDATTTNLGPLGELVIDLNDQCTQALAVFRYQLKEGAADELFGALADDTNQTVEQRKLKFCRAIKERLAMHYEPAFSAVDPNDATNVKKLDWSYLRTVVFGGFINAQRGLDDVTHKERDVLGKVLEALLGSAMSSSANAQDQAIASNLKAAVDEMQASIDGGFSVQLNQLLPAFTLFGYPGLADPNLRTETVLDVQRLLTNHTRIHYAGVNGINLPEAYNGLGARNLIYILLRLLEFYKGFLAQDPTPAVHLIFIEEPEVHLHPQMQEVFVGKISAIAGVFASTFNNGTTWPVQFVVTTHSSHVANRTPFEALRYFFASSGDQQPALRSTQIKDLRAGLSSMPVPDREFLHKYMTLTRCDLLFADKAILIEGTTERILLPKMIAKSDEAAGATEAKLSSQYVSVVEIGGAHAHLFFPLLRFLELRTLVITDLDSVNIADDNKKCLVTDGTGTSNTCIKNWFSNSAITPSELLLLDAAAKISSKRRIAFQIPDDVGGPCGRSFEDAFALRNQEVAEFEFAGVADSEKAEHAWNKALAVGKKSDFALRFAVDETSWFVPKYIEEGLRWLAEGRHIPTPADLAGATHTAAPLAARPVVIMPAGVPSTALTIGTTEGAP